MIRLTRAGLFRPALFIPLLLVTAICLAWAVQPTPLAAQESLQSPPFDLAEVPMPEDAPAARLGQGIYLQNCAPCHGDQGLGDGPTAADLPNQPTAFADPDTVWAVSPAELFHTTKFGRMAEMMPPWRNQLSDVEIWRAVAYAWSLHTDMDTVAAGEDLYGLSCTSCHGPTGAGDGPEAEGDLPDFSDPSYAMPISAEAWLARWQAAHPEIGGEWSADEQRQVLEYIRTFTLLPVWESGYQPGPGVIRGTVVQGTPDGPALEQTEVRLEGYVDFQPVAVFTTTVDADGVFMFTDLAADESVAYLASLGYGGIRYSSPIITLTADAPSAETALTVYETTDDPATIRIDRAHWIVDYQPGALLVGQILSYGSSSDRTFVGRTVEGVDVPVTVAFHLPQGAEELLIENGTLGDRFRQVGDLVYDTAPLIPGEATKQIIARYAIPYPETSAQLSQQFLYPVTSGNLLVADAPGLDISVSGLEGGDPQNFEGQSFRIWQGASLPAESTVEVMLNGLPAPGTADPRGTSTGTAANMPPTPGQSTAVLAWAMGGLALLTLAGVLGWAWQQGRVQTHTPSRDPAQQRDDLIRRIAELDDRYAQGQLDQAQWQSQRAGLKAKLLELSLRTSGRDSS